MIKKRIFYMTMAIFLAYSALVFLYQHESMKTLLNHEIKEDAIKNLKLSIGIINNEILSLEAATRDYANWDETYGFVESGDLEFLEVSMNDKALSDLGVELVALYDTNNGLVHRAGIGGRMTHDQIDGLVRSSGINIPTALRAGVSGLMDHEGVMYMFSIQPIRDSMQNYPANGALLFAREAEPYLEKRMNTWFDEVPKFVGIPENEDVKVHADFVEDESLFAELFDQSIKPSGDFMRFNTKVTVSCGDDDSLLLHFALKDFRGKIIRHLEVSEPNTLITRGKGVASTVVVLTLASGLCIALFFSFSFNKYFVRPIEELKQHMTDFNMEHTDIDENINGALRRNDELGDLTRGFVGMQESILQANEYMKNINLMLEEEVEERTNQLREANNELLLSDTIITNSSEGIMICDADARIIRANDAFCELSGYTREELIGQNPRLLKSNRHGEAFYKAMWQKIADTGNWSGEIWDRRKNGEVYPKWLSITAIRDESGTLTNYTSISSDISRMKAAEEELRMMAFYDTLTGLPNRALFYDRLSQSLKNLERHERNFALFFMDLDGFKHVNDTWGHNIGDELLIEVGQRLNALIRHSDTVSRNGGDEFTMILHNAGDEEQLAEIAQKIIRIIEEPFELGDLIVHVGISIGIALAPQDETTLDGLIKKADSAMYLSKSRGRRCYSFASEEVIGEGDVLVFRK